jgi:aryl-alcohol dehydrogenase-like predicted oxidoreductase
MQRGLVTLDGTSVTVSRIGFGTASLHHRFWQRDRLDLLESAVSLGLSHIDTSPYYGDGLAEHDIGTLSPALRSRITVATKVGLLPRWGSSRSSVSLRLRRAAIRLARVDTSPIADLDVAQSSASLDRSLRRMRRACIDLLLLHEPDVSRLDHGATLDWLSGCQRAGKIRSWGLAGTRRAVEPFLHCQSEIAMVIQTADSVDGHEAEFLQAYNRPMQITYGYMRSRSAGRVVPDPIESLRAGLSRNATGTVLVSTRSLSRLGLVSTLL